MIKVHNKRILILAAHPDDAEFSSGASIHKWIKSGADVYYAAFSPCVKSLPEGADENTLFVEMSVGAACLGIKDEQTVRYDYPVREFPNYRQPILEDLILLKKELRPDLVLVPNRDDVHQDHHQLHLEAMRAFKHSTLLGYELPWNNFQNHMNCYIEISSENLAAKVKAIQAYKSQEHRTYIKEDFIRSLARVRGVQAQVEFAEGFEVLRLYG